ncbi:uncharacterized protein LOC124471468 [Hypomesus transpacificus]|uniref:uncharacterized protein LOC124471468 n=1 Tax=Hypomesus transpacificus TaxID=137520 RepID=UPI001F08746D|nr:uncharacterized protein LOC124471468 [Hypomesus transpacificus]XP_046881929.1 uncharacterized protein LOC124471468 [Hypomesus transpacificus]XP_046881930.1 uncharacterized protein LOC124471468 [Hypomesus transpacificus]XP_046881931.1 uncharacterized protein LOC124471468 [Hypomesus transpacificus]
MNSTPAPTLFPVRDRLPPKKRDPRQAEPEQTPAATFKVPYPYKSQHAGRSKNGVKPLYTPYLDLSPSMADPVTTLYQPWVQSNTVTRSKPYIPYPVRDRPGWEKLRDFYHRSWAAVDSRLEVPFIPSHHMGNPRELSTSVLPLDHPRHTTKIRPIVMSTEHLHGTGLGYRLELSGARGQLPSPSGRPNETYMRRRGKQWNQTQRITETNPAHLSLDFTSPVYDLSKLDDTKHSTTSSKFAAAPALSYQSVDQHWTLGTAKDVRVSPPPSPVLRSSPSDQAPWLLPHFAAGSLIELRDGRLKRVEDLQTEDFQLGSEVSPELHISSCTVQHISPSSSPAFSRLLILLHKELSQELLDVFVEYPFFVCGRGWSSCCPQRTARLCGLRCHQLSVGDICLALTPAPPPSPRPSSQGPDVPASGAEEESEPLQRSSPQPAQDLPQASASPGGGLAPKRRRRWSAPELPGPGATCPD